MIHNSRSSLVSDIPAEDRNIEKLFLPCTEPLKTDLLRTKKKQINSRMFSLCAEMGLRWCWPAALLLLAGQLSATCTLPGERVHFELITGQVYTSPNHMLGKTRYSQSKTTRYRVLVPPPL